MAEESFSFMNYKAFGEVEQDRFAYDWAKAHKLSTGTFLDIGCGDPFDCNNTYGLELIGWHGVGVDYNPEIVAKFNTSRITHAICENALTIDWKTELTAAGLGSIIDFLSLDLMDEEPDIMKALLEAGFSFHVITIEHDNEPEIKRKERELLSGAGYTLIKLDVLAPAWGPNQNRTPFEDWWTHE